jgi:ligand-binding sensor domain-containing protein
VAGKRWSKVGNGFKGDFILCLKRTDEALWIGTARDGAYCLLNGSFMNFDTMSGLCDNNVWDLCLSPDKGILFCSRYNGLTRMLGGNFTCLSRDSGLPDREVTLARMDSRGNTWIGTAAGGLCMFGARDTLYYNTRNGLSGNYVRALLCDSTARWLGTWDGGLDFFNGNSWEHVPGVPAPVVALQIDGTGRVWAGTWGGGIYIREKEGWRNVNPANSGLPDDHVIDIRFDAAGHVYLATNKGLACWKFR